MIQSPNVIAHQRPLHKQMKQVCCYKQFVFYRINSICTCRNIGYRLAHCHFQYWNLDKTKFNVLQFDYLE